MNTKTLNIELLKSLNACQSGIDFVKKANLEGFPLNKLDQVVGDHGGFVDWLKIELKTDREYNEQGLMTKKIDPWGDVYQYEYNEQGLKTKEIYPSGRVYQWEYKFNDNNKLTSISGDSNLIIPDW